MSRKADVRHYLQEFCGLAQVDLAISEMDVCRDPSVDLLDEAIAKRALEQIRDGSWDVVIVTPPVTPFLGSDSYRLAQNQLDQDFILWVFLGYLTICWNWPGKETSSSISHSRYALLHWMCALTSCSSIRKTWDELDQATHRLLFGSWKGLSACFHMNGSSHLLFTSASIWQSHPSQPAS